MAPSERAVFLESHCSDWPEMRSELESLLGAYDDSDGFLGEPALGSSFKVGDRLRGPLEDDGDEHAGGPERIGAYRVLREIGRGGMGVVYEAEQDAPRRHVAIKVIRSGALTREAVRRFEREAEVLGLLQHPGIAQIHEAGVFDDGSGARPFFAMEYVDGPPLSQFLRDRPLDLKSQLELFIQICDAVHHAHQKGVIHRDLKPGNILAIDDFRLTIDDSKAGQSSIPNRHSSIIKILDFGVARATDLDLAVSTLTTDVNRLIGTLPYMSPEQVSGDARAVDVRADVYALGVILYEMLTKRLPHDLTGQTLAAAARIIAEEEPAPLDSFDRSLRGDVTTITLKALSKDPERRYPSANALANDVRRFLNREPVSARPATAIYQLRRFAQRNRGLFGGVVVAAVALILGVFGLAYGMIKAQIERDEALRQEQLASAADIFLNDLIGSTDPDHLGVEATVHDLLASAAEQIEGRFVNEPLVRAGILTTLGNAHFGIGEYHNARPFHEEARALFLAELGPEHKLTLRSAGNLANTYAKLGLIQEAEDLLLTARETAERVFGPEHVETISAVEDLATFYIDFEKFDAAEPLIERVADAYRRSLKKDHRAELKSRTSLGMLRSAQGRHREAEAILRETVETMRRDMGRSHLATLNAMNALAITLRELGRNDEAFEILSYVVEERERRLGPEHPYTLDSRHNLANAYSALGSHDEAEIRLREVLEARTRTLGETHYDTIRAMNALVGVLTDRGAFDEAAALGETCVELYTQALGSDHPSALSARNALAIALKELGRLGEAESLALESLRGYQRTYGEAHVFTLPPMNTLATIYRDQRRNDEAEELLLDMLAIYRCEFDSDHPKLLGCLNNLAVVYYEQKRFDEAEPLFAEALTIRRRVSGEDHPDTLMLQNNLANVHSALRRFHDAERILADLVDRRMRISGESHPHTIVAQYNLGRVYKQQERYERAAALLAAAVAGGRRAFGESHMYTGMFLRDYAVTLAALGNDEDAESAFLEAIDIFERAGQDTSVEQRKAIANLIAFYEERGRNDLAAAWRSRQADD